MNQVERGIFHGIVSPLKARKRHYTSRNGDAISLRTEPMTASEVLIWFAERGPHPVPKRLIQARLGDVRWQIEDLHDLGLLNCHLNYGLKDVTFSLKNHGEYQKRKAA